VALSILLTVISIAFNKCGIITRPDSNTISNSFVFFGHTDYGGDGGEGAFVYPGNEKRYDEASQKYFLEKNIAEPTLSDYNAFQAAEIKKYITQHPVKWTILQGRKFFRTFGVVPESNSFMVLYTGLLGGNKWLTAMTVVLPVAIILLLFIFLFDFESLRKLRYYPGDKILKESASGLHRQNVKQYPDNDRNPFLVVFVLMFIYYIAATIFYGQYQERYRMPVMVIFIIPVLAYFIATFDRRKLKKLSYLRIRGSVILVFFGIWTFQAFNAVSNSQRLEKGLKRIEKEKTGILTNKTPGL
jgi:hypothetical protein